MEVKKTAKYQESILPTFILVTGLFCFVWFLLFFCLTDQLICNVIQGAHLHPHPHLRTEIKNLDEVFLVFRASRLKNPDCDLDTVSHVNTLNSLSESL